MSSTKKYVYTTSNGAPVTGHPYGAQTAGPGGPLLLQDFNLMDSLSHFDHERVPERVVHAKGSAFHGFFECTDPLSDITTAELFQKKGYKCSVSVRFSTVGGESGSADTVRDPRGFAIKFRLAESGAVWDMVGNNTPVFFIRDPLKFPHFIHTQKRDPKTHLNHMADATMYWDYLTQNVESIHQITYMFGDRGIPADFGAMNGYSGHTFKFLNSEGEITYVQIHVLAQEGFKTLDPSKAGELAGSLPDYNLQSMLQRLEQGKFPKYNVYVQTMTPKQAEEFKYSINDLTKIWPHSEFPLRKVGEMVLNRAPENYFAETEQLAFSPSHLIPGIEPSNDPVLQSRLYSYSDTHRHRLGANYQQLPVNRPPAFDPSSGCPFLAGNFQRDGIMTFDNHPGMANYISKLDKGQVVYTDKAGSVSKPKTYYGVVLNEASERSLQEQMMEAKRDHEAKIWSKHCSYISGVSELDLEQPRALFDKVYSAEQQHQLVENVVGHVSSIKDTELKQHVAQYFGLLNDNLGAAIGKGLGVSYKHLSLHEYCQSVGVSNV